VSISAGKLADCQPQTSQLTHSHYFSQLPQISVFAGTETDPLACSCLHDRASALGPPITHSIQRVYVETIWRTPSFRLCYWSWISGKHGADAAE